MSGIAKIKQRRVEESSNLYQQSKQLLIRDGDQALVAIVVTGEEDDNEKRLDSFNRHVYAMVNEDGSTRWAYKLCLRSIDQVCLRCENFPQERIQRCFGVWVYCYDVFHKQQLRDSWERVDRKGVVVYRENVNDFRLIVLGFGKNDVVFNQLVNIHEEYGELNSRIVRFIRNGRGRDDTSYTFSVTVGQINWTDQLIKDAAELPGVTAYLRSLESEEAPISLVDNKLDDITSVSGSKNLSKSNVSDDTDDETDDILKDLF